MRILFAVLAIFLCCPTALQCQLSVLKGTVYPSAPHANTWFLNTETQQVTAFKKGVWWRASAQKFTDIQTCNQFIILKGNPEASRGNNQDYYTVLDTSGMEIVNTVSDVFCGEAILGIHYGAVFYCIPNSGSAKDMGHHMLTFAFTEQCNTFVPDTVQGMPAFCAPEPFMNPGTGMTCENIHYWGMLGTNGKWLIPPKFDSAFHFENGVADVLYYGQRRKINEKGEFVE